MKVLVSACLLGENCKYNAGNNLNNEIVDFLKDREVLAICPEVLGGLTTPRLCAEIKNGVVYNSIGESVDAEFRKGVELTLEAIKNETIEMVILKSRSPSCGVNKIYDGTFSGKLIEGQGLLAKSLIDRGYRVVDSDEFKSN